MNKIKLPNVTLLGIDCIDVERLAQAMDVSESGIEFGAVKLLTSLPTTDKRKIEIPHIGTIEEFSRFCIEDLYKYVDTDYVLLVQYDGFILNPESWTDEFLKYDYIGAPWLVADWSVRDFDFPENLLGTWVVGNGGFCLRSKKFLEISARLAYEGKIPKLHPEDVAMCIWYKDVFENEGVQFAPPDVAKKFSIEGDDAIYKEQFGFHGFKWTDISLWIDEHPEYPVIVGLFRKARAGLFQSTLIRERGELLGKITNTFETIAIEGHLFGSMARGDTDALSDIDIWLVFKDEDIDTVFNKRFEYYAKIGEVIHVVEPPQNAPIGGIQSAVLYKVNGNLFIVDYSLCPLSTAYIVEGNKKLFGNVDLPLGEAGFNPQKVVVPESYRIDFFISFIFNGIKKIIRKDTDGFDHIVKEYDYLSSRYGLKTNELSRRDQSFDTLTEIMEKIYLLSNYKQKNALNEIQSFVRIIKNYE